MAPRFNAASGGEQGWMPHARHMPSPNADDRPAGMTIDLLVIHCIALPPRQYGGDAIEQLFCNRLDYQAHPAFSALEGLRVSAHFVVRRDGVLTQYVSCDRRAWHAGASRFAGRERCNDFSIGIELEGSDDEPFEAEQYETLIALGAELFARYPLRAIAGHGDIAPGRKTDPGIGFDWRRLKNGLALPARAFPFQAF
ncbi:MAG: 1,6-anhydro-N-acetylmuramyl-L-alanine amidase AmpD [Thiomonas sp.]|uniref:1,6-anhydro-N-acetylmuramyl-L-alanine amidase AmpD n=1 Tax=Thiomonas sp. TaxID=2047785 RepID=UPI002A36AE52|nr:1,6-anhydro-N-acetylmuramyl-L-alanine amidase AmpD [Thiomonas sp.]MDY0330537.1 1,6-anhydro-N-acetylmuramyl-L-alanine amidase AmpD [Thiomonas sp.]